MSRGLRVEIERWFVSPAKPANPAAPTRAEITAATEITDSIATISGFSLTNSPVNTPDLGSRRVKKVTGLDNAGDSSLTLWDETIVGIEVNDAARDVLAKDSEIFMFILPHGDFPGERMEVWQVTSTGVNDQRSMTEAAQYMVGFADGEVLEQGAVVPALT